MDLCSGAWVKPLENEGLGVFPWGALAGTLEFFIVLWNTEQELSIEIK